MFHCIGCGGKIPWDGQGLFSYTCPCRATIFVNDESGNLALPCSLVIGVSKGTPLPHLDSLVGTSDYTSPEKERLIAELQDKGSIWMEECPQCRVDGTWERTMRHRERDKALEAVKVRVSLGELTDEEAIQEMMAVDKRFENQG